MAAKIIVLIFSLAALYLLARHLRLGRGVGILTAAHARKIAFDALYGFDAIDAVVDREGQSALLKGRNGRFAVIQRHGTHFVAREFSAPVNCGRPVYVVDENDWLTLRSNIFPKGHVTLNLGLEAAAWRDRLEENT